MSETKPKPFEIDKWAVWEAYERVKANRGAAGVDGVSLKQLEDGDLKGSLYKLWNRLSSGSYFPPPVRLVEIPKRGGGTRPLGIPTVLDRIAQTVVAAELEKVVEPIFHPDSYGYRPGRSAQDAIAVCRQRCWQYPWVLDLDIKSFFDTIDHQRMLAAVAHHIDLRWVLLYVQRWLQAPVQQPDGTLVGRDRGTPQGSAVSPVLSNLFLHYAFDVWMQRTFPQVPFERYADDIVVHCDSHERAEQVRDAVAARLVECGLQLHPDKTRIVYCKQSGRTGSHEHEQFDFLSHTFRPRGSKSPRGYFVGFLPAISDKAAQRLRDEVKGWRLHLRSGQTLQDLAAWINPIVRGWIGYYGCFYRSRLTSQVLRHLNTYLARWAMRKFKRLRRSRRRAYGFLARIARDQPTLFAHWALVRP